MKINYTVNGLKRVLSGRQCQDDTYPLSYINRLILKRDFCCVEIPLEVQFFF